MGERSILPDRGVVSVTGPDAKKLLAGLVTNDMALLDRQPALYAALLTPQGKILFDFLIVAADGGYLLDTDRVRAPDLAKRLSLYKLRADVAIADLSGAFDVGAAWGDDAHPLAAGDLVYADPRLAALGVRWLARRDGIPRDEADDQPATSDDNAAAYHAHRVALGVPQGGRDFDFGDIFPHEALLDQLHGVSFTKGCFVGQEVVSRMQHRTTVRKRVVMVEAASALPGDRPAVMIGAAEIGRLGSVSGVRGLALLRIDRVAEAQRDGLAVTAGEIALAVRVPPFATFEIKGPHEVA